MASIIKQLKLYKNNDWTTYSIGTDASKVTCEYENESTLQGALNNIYDDITTLQRNFSLKMYSLPASTSNQSMKEFLNNHDVTGNYIIFYFNNSTIYTKNDFLNTSMFFFNGLLMDAADYTLESLSPTGDGDRVKMIFNQYTDLINEIQDSDKFAIKIFSLT